MNCKKTRFRRFLNRFLKIRQICQGQMLSEIPIQYLLSLAIWTAGPLPGCNIRMSLSCLWATTHVMQCRNNRGPAKNGGQRCVMWAPFLAWCACWWDAASFQTEPGWGKTAVPDMCRMALGKRLQFCSLQLLCLYGLEFEFQIYI